MNYAINHILDNGKIEQCPKNGKLPQEIQNDGKEIAKQIDESESFHNKPHKRPPNQNKKYASKESDRTTQFTRLPTQKNSKKKKKNDSFRTHRRAPGRRT